MDIRAPWQYSYNLLSKSPNIPPFHQIHKIKRTLFAKNDSLSAMITQQK